MSNRTILSGGAIDLPRAGAIEGASPSFDRPRPRAGMVRRLLRALADAHERWLQRQALADLDDRMLKDIGVTGAERDRECGRSALDGHTAG